MIAGTEPMVAAMMESGPTQYYDANDNPDPSSTGTEEYDFVPIANDMRRLARSERKKRGVRNKMAKASRRRNRI